MNILGPVLCTLKGNLGLGAFLLLQSLDQNQEKVSPLGETFSFFHLFLHNYPASNQTGGDRSHGRDSNPLRLLDDVNPITRDSAIFLAMPLRYLHLGGYEWIL